MVHRVLSVSCVGSCFVLFVVLVLVVLSCFGKCSLCCFFWSCYCKRLFGLIFYLKSFRPVRPGLVTIYIYSGYGDSKRVKCAMERIHIHCWADLFTEVAKCMLQLSQHLHCIKQ